MNKQRLILFTILWLWLLLLNTGLSAIPSARTPDITSIASDTLETGVDSLLELALTYKGSDMSRALGYARQALRSASGDPPAKARVMHTLGSISMDGSRYDSAGYYYGQALQCYPVDDPKRISLMRDLSFLLSEIQQYDSALTLLKRAGTKAQEINSASLMAGIRASMGITYENLNRSDTALVLYYEALEYYRKHQNMENVAVILNNIGSLLINTNNPEKAIGLLMQARRINDSLGNSRGIITCNNNLAAAYKHTGEYHRAITLLQENIDILQKDKPSVDLAINYVNLGNNLLGIRNYARAKQCYDSSLRLCRQLNLAYGILINHINLGSTYLQMDSIKASYRHLHRALELTGRDTLNTTSVRLYDIWYQYFYATGRYDSSLYYYKKKTLISDSLDHRSLRIKLRNLEDNKKLALSRENVVRLENTALQNQSRHRVIQLVSITTILILIMVIIYLNHRKKHKKLTTELLQKEKRILEDELRYNRRELTSSALHLAQQNDQTIAVIEGLESLLPKASPQVHEAINEIIQNIRSQTNDNLWKEFEVRFEKVHENFISRLMEACPDLTPTEIRVCSLLRLNLTSKDIAALSNRSIRTIEGTRNSIRRKFGLEATASLSNFLMSL